MKAIALAPLALAAYSAVVVLTSDGMTWLPYGSATIPPTECAP